MVYLPSIHVHVASVSIFRSACTHLDQLDLTKDKQMDCLGYELFPLFPSNSVDNERKLDAMQFNVCQTANLDRDRLCLNENRHISLCFSEGRSQNNLAQIEMGIFLSWAKAQGLRLNSSEKDDASVFGICRSVVCALNCSKGYSFSRNEI